MVGRASVTPSVKYSIASSRFLSAGDQRVRSQLDQLLALYLFSKHGASALVFSRVVIPPDPLQCAFQYFAIHVCAIPAESLVQATALIVGLGGERTRWTEDSRKFADTKRRLVGDVAMSCAFVGYCGPFNQEFRDQLVKTRYATGVRICPLMGEVVQRLMNVRLLS